MVPNNFGEIKSVVFFQVCFKSEDLVWDMCNSQVCGERINQRCSHLLQSQLQAPYQTPRQMRPETLGSRALQIKQSTAHTHTLLHSRPSHHSSTYSTHTQCPKRRSTRAEMHNQKLLYMGWTLSSTAIIRICLLKKSTWKVGWFTNYYVLLYFHRSTQQALVTGHALLICQTVALVIEAATHKGQLLRTTNAENTAAWAGLYCNATKKGPAPQQPGNDYSPWLLLLVLQEVIQFVM